MSRTLLPFQTDDLSAFAKALGGELRALDRVPGHVELLNMLARAGGCRNFQHLRAQAAARAALAEAPAPEPVVDYLRLRRTLRLFDPAGRLLRWPPKLWERELALWVLWAAFPPRAALAEKAVNAWLDRLHDFADPALLRRWLVDLGFVTRNPDGSDYRRVERRPRRWRCSRCSPGARNPRESGNSRAGLMKIASAGAGTVDQTPSLRNSGGVPERRCGRERAQARRRRSNRPRKLSGTRNRSRSGGPLESRRA